MESGVHEPRERIGGSGLVSVKKSNSGTAESKTAVRMSGRSDKSRVRRPDLVLSGPLCPTVLDKRMRSLRRVASIRKDGEACAQCITTSIIAACNDLRNGKAEMESLVKEKK